MASLGTPSHHFWEETTAGSATTMCTQLSTTTAVSPIRRSTPTNKEPPAPDSWNEPSTTSADHGIHHIEEVMTDNHWSYTQSRAFAEALSRLDADHLRIRPHCPWQNGKGRTLQPDPPDRMGLPPSVHQQPPTQPSPATMARVLQPETATHRPRRPPTNQPTVNNLMAGYT